MINPRYILIVSLLASIVTACGSQTLSKPLPLLDAESYTAEGLQAYAAGDWTTAHWLFSRALSLFQGIDDQSGVLHSHINLVELALAKRDYETARKHLERADEIVKQAPVHQFQSRISLLYVQLALGLNQVTQAESQLQSLLPEFNLDKPITMPDQIQLTAIANRTKIAAIQKRDEQLWIQRYANALKLSGNKDSIQASRLLRFQSGWLQQHGDFKASETKLLQALAGYKNNHARSGIAVTLSELGQLKMAQSQWQAAAAYLNRSLAVYLGLRDVDMVIQVAEKKLKVLIALGKTDRSKVLKLWITDLKRKKQI